MFFDSPFDPRRGDFHDESVASRHADARFDTFQTLFASAPKYAEGPSFLHARAQLRAPSATYDLALAGHPDKASLLRPIIGFVRMPPPLDVKPAWVAWYAVSGLVLIVLGLIAEFGIRPKPIVPASFVPGFLFLCVGAAVAIAVADRYLPKFGCLIGTFPAVTIFLVQTTGGNSALPLFMFAGICQLLRAGLRAAPFDDAGR